MEANTAIAIAESHGAFMYMEKGSKVYKIHFSMASCLVEAADLEQVTEDSFKDFIYNVLMHEQRALVMYGGPTVH